MMEQISKDEAALVAHKVVLAILVSEAEVRLGDDAATFLDQIRHTAVASIQKAQGADDTDLRYIKQLIVEAIGDIFNGS